MRHQIGDGFVTLVSYPRENGKGEVCNSEGKPVIVKAIQV